MTNPVLVEVTRGERVESWHRGAMAVVDATGRVRVSIGDIERPIFPRSAVKAIQALPLVEGGAADAYGFGDAELALAAASHNGEPRHVELARSMLDRAGQTAGVLECGPQPSRFSTDSGAGTPLHNNCSGKHAGFVCVACHAGISPTGYVEPDHEVQREVREALAAVTGSVLGPELRGIDGCSIPTYAIPLRNLAHGYARMMTGEGLPPTRAAAARRILDASMREPFLVAGTGRYCTEVMSLFPGDLYVKTGAEGVFCGAITELGLGIAVKCDDGGTRAAETMMSAVINALLPIGWSEQSLFRHYLEVPVRSRRGAIVGVIRPAADLASTLTAARVS